MLGRLSLPRPPLRLPTWGGAIGSPIPPAKTSSTIVGGVMGRAASQGTVVPQDGGSGSGNGSGGGGGSAIHDAALSLQHQQSVIKFPGAVVPQTGASSGGCDLRGYSGVSFAPPSSSMGSIVEDDTKNVAHRISDSGGSGGGGSGGGGSSGSDQVHDRGTAAAYAAKAADIISSGSSAASTNHSANAGQHQQQSQTHSAVIRGE